MFATTCTPTPLRSTHASSTRPAPPPRRPARPVHDEHFLLRLGQRLEREHVSLALGLYHDSELVKYVLDRAELPDGVDRIALSLDDPQAGPFVIVTREGRFVTCLAPGMRLRPGQPSVSRARLDELGGRIAKLRELIAESRDDRSERIARIFSRLANVGDRLGREEFDELARWAPLLSRHFVMALLESLIVAEKVWPILAGRRRGRLTKQAARLYWNASWTATHCAMLLASDDGEHIDQLVRDAAVRRLPSFGRLLVDAFALRECTSMIARVGWIAGKHPEHLTDAVAAGWTDVRSLSHTLADGLALATIGICDRSGRPQVREQLARSPRTIAGDDADAACAARSRVLHRFDEVVAAPERSREVALAGAHADLASFATRHQGEAARRIAELPPELAIAFLAQLTLPVDDRGTARLLAWMPWIATAEARDFYLPASQVSLLRTPWLAGGSAELVAVRRNTTVKSGATVSFDGR
jgi:hypothetical protein